MEFPSEPARQTPLAGSFVIGASASMLFALVATFMDSKYRENWNLTGWKCETPDYIVKGRV